MNNFSVYLQNSLISVSQWILLDPPHYLIFVNRLSFVFLDSIQWMFADDLEQLFRALVVLNDISCVFLTL